jgi:hypothetical protein
MLSQVHPGERWIEQKAWVTRTGFDEQYSSRRLFEKSTSDHTTCGAGTDNDEVKLFGHQTTSKLKSAND